MSDLYTTVLWSDGWWCNCPSPYVPDPSTVMTYEQAMVDADGHVSHYRDTWPHLFIEGDRQ